MARTQIRGNTQIMDSTISFGKLQSEFLAGTTWVLSSSNDAVITGLQNPTNNNDAVNKAYVDSMISTTAKGPDEWDASTGSFPTEYKTTGVITEGDPFVVTVDGVVDGVQYRVGDMIIAKADGGGATASDWISVQANVDSATESVEGIVRLATQAETDNGTLDTAVVTPLKLAGYITNNDLDVQAGNGLTQNGKNFDVRNTDGSISVGVDDISVRIGNTNGDSLEVTTTGVELRSTIAGDRTFSNNITVGGTTTLNGGLTAGGTVTLGTNTNDVVLAAGPDGTVDLAIATTKYVNDTISTSVGIKVYNEVPTVTGGSTDITLNNTPRADTQRVYLNGVRQVPGASNDYTISGNTITFTDALLADDIVVVDYIY